MTVINERQKQLLIHKNLFGEHLFHQGIIEARLPSKTASHLQRVLQGIEVFDLKEADCVAEALKTWALEKGATHYAHWFQPLSGRSAEKQTTFLTGTEIGQTLYQLKGKELFYGEPDASSFPSGHLRTTHEARGYTSWDLVHFPFLWETEHGMTLYIPALFFSWNGEALDHKIPLLRSEQKIDHAVRRLLHLFHKKVERVYSTLGPEQEYFLINEELYRQRTDLFLTGRTLFGRPPAKGQELEDHYFSPLAERSLAFFTELEERALRLGIPLKARHHEVAPAQYECAPLFEKASLAADHNLLLMDLLQTVAQKHGLACLLHEKPFAGINGSGKHNNWSLMTDQGENLLDPEINPLLFLTILTATLHAVHSHASLLRAAIASPGNDHRLGGSEAPPTILSVYLGTSLEEQVERFMAGGAPTLDLVKKTIDLGLSHRPLLVADASDRNRTSFFAFTGNKFEFRAVGSSAHCSWPITLINTLVADSLELLLDEVETAPKPLEALLPALRKQLKQSRGVLFGGNGYSAEWMQEAERRGLPNIKKSFHALAALVEPKSIRVVDGVLSEQELQARYHIFVEQYAKTLLIETNLMIDLFRTQIFPAALQHQHQWAESLCRLEKLGIPSSREELQGFHHAVETASRHIAALEQLRMHILSLGWEAKAKALAELMTVQMEEARRAIDLLEGWVEDRLWPVPKYRELLYS